jgi:hypothetical protein
MRNPFKIYGTRIFSYLSIREQQENIFRKMDTRLKDIALKIKKQIILTLLFVGLIAFKSSKAH